MKPFASACLWIQNVDVSFKTSDYLISEKLCFLDPWLLLILICQRLLLCLALGLPTTQSGAASPTPYV